MRWITALAAVFFLSGCAVPTPISVATFAFDVGSYVLSGKTMSDHGLSLLTQQDCQFSRITDGDICREPLNLEETGPTLEPLTDQQVAALLDYSSGVTDAGDVGGAGPGSAHGDNIMMGFAESAAPLGLPGQLATQERMPLRARRGYGGERDPLADAGFLGSIPADGPNVVSDRKNLSKLDAAGRAFAG
ncbi:MAG: hypothetical protein R3316_02740 [Rhodovibrionaceae bacterium]|nr:hypothetical protein [Rhodovibrionaceae bacterium]